MIKFRNLEWLSPEADSRIGCGYTRDRQGAVTFATFQGSSFSFIIRGMMRQRRGKFIVLDGVDGSGKGTQVKILASYLFDREKRNHVFLTREPYNSKYYEKIRQILMESKNSRDHAELLAKLFVKDRRVHARLIKNLMEQGLYVVSDRYKYSTLAYQKTQGISLAELIEMHKDVLVPDLAIILDVPVEIALKRVVEDRGRKYKEVFEEQKFQQELRKNFLELPKHLPKEKIVIIDAAKSLDTVSKAIRNEVNLILSQ